MKTVLLFLAMLAAPCLAIAGHVTDNDNIFSREAVKRAEARLAGVEKKSGVHVAVIGVGSLNGGDASSRAEAAYRSSGYNADSNRGVVFVISRDERSAAVYPNGASELPEGLSQASAAQIIGGRIMPSLILGDLDSALDGAVDGGEQTLGGATSYTGALVIAIVSITIAMAAVLASVSLVTVIPFAVAVATAACWFFFPEHRYVAAATVLLLLGVSAAVARVLFRASDAQEIIEPQPEGKGLTPSDVWNWQMQRGVTFDRKPKAIDDIDGSRVVAPAAKRDEAENDQ